MRQRRARGTFTSETSELFKPETANLSLSLGVPKGPFSFAKENGPFDSLPHGVGNNDAALRALQCPLAPNGRDSIPPNQFGDRIFKNPKSLLFDSPALQYL